MITYEQAGVSYDQPDAQYDGGQIAPTAGRWVATGTVRRWNARGTARRWYAAGTQRTWIAGRTLMTDNILAKTPGDALLRFALDFSPLPELAGSVTIASVTSVVASPTGPTIGGIQVDTGSKSASALFSGGTNGADYDVTFTVVLSTGATLERTGVLRVRTK